MIRLFAVHLGRYLTCRTGPCKTVTFFLPVESIRNCDWLSINSVRSCDWLSMIFQPTRCLFHFWSPVQKEKEKTLFGQLDRLAFNSTWYSRWSGLRSRTWLFSFWRSTSHHVRDLRRFCLRSTIKSDNWSALCLSHSLTNYWPGPISDYHWWGQFNKQYLVYVFVGRRIDKERRLSLAWHVTSCVSLSLTNRCQSKGVDLTCFHSLYYLFWGVFGRRLCSRMLCKIFARV